MSTTTLMQVSPLRAIGKTIGWIFRFALLVVLYVVLLVAGSAIVSPYLPATPAEPGPVPQMAGLLIVCVTTVLVIMLMIQSSRWYGLKLMAALALAYYLVVTVVTQLEAWYFLYGVTIRSELMSRLFLQGMPAAFIFVPLAVLIMGRLRAPVSEGEINEIAPMTIKDWIWKLGIIYLAYLILYYTAGYFIAWQNPEVRAFYGSPGDALPFFQQMAHVFSTDPWLTPYQLIRTLIWVAGAFLVIRGSRLPLWQTAIIVGLMLSVPQNIGHILPNSLIPSSSVRISHLIETASSTFVFGLVVTWLLYPKINTGKS